MNNNYFRKLIATIFAAILLIISIVPLVSSIPVKNQSAPLNIDWWPMFSHDANHIGYSTSSAPETNDVLWSYQTGDFITSSPAVLDGKLYIGSWDEKLYCFDMMNGDMLWNFTTNGQITASPAVDDGKVYFGSQDSTFYCLDADDGSQIWEFETNFMIESSPTIKDNKVFFGSSGGSLYCLNANTGTFIWEYTTGNVIWSSPAVTDDGVYFGSFSGDFFCLDIVDGDLVWNYTTTSVIQSSPAVYDGNVYFGSNDEYVYCLDADDGDFIWSYDTSGEVQASPAIAYGNVYIGVSGKGVFCLNAETGDLVWQYLINNGVWSPPSVADDKVYYGTDNCCGKPRYFHCNDAHTGESVWKYNTGEITMTASPAIAAGKVFIGAGDGRVFAFGGDELYVDANGPYTGIEKIPIQFKGSVYGGKPEYTWHWDFGDGESSYEQNPTHSYTSSGDYIVTLTVTDDNDDVAIDETTAFIEEDPNLPPITPVIEGQLNGKIGEEYTYCIPSIIDPNGDNIYVFWDWGDGTNSNWTGPYASGEQVCEKHIWNISGDYTIKAKLKDENGAESDWGELQVTMPRNKAHSNMLLLKLLERFTWHFPLISYLLNR